MRRPRCHYTRWPRSKKSVHEIAPRRDHKHRTGGRAREMKEDTITPCRPPDAQEKLPAFNTDDPNTRNAEVDTTEAFNIAIGDVQNLDAIPERHQPSKKTRKLEKGQHRILSSLRYCACPLDLEEYEFLNNFVAFHGRKFSYASSALSRMYASSRIRCQGCVCNLEGNFLVRREPVRLLQLFDSVHNKRKSQDAEDRVSRGLFSTEMPTLEYARAWNADDVYAGKNALECLKTRQQSLQVFPEADTDQTTAEVDSGIDPDFITSLFKKSPIIAARVDTSVSEEQIFELDSDANRIQEKRAVGCAEEKDPYLCTESHDFHRIVPSRIPERAQPGVILAKVVAKPLRKRTFLKARYDCSAPLICPLKFADFSARIDRAFKRSELESRRLN